MARKKGAPCWRAAFLRALGRTGNVSLAARMAGVDKSTVYQARGRDEGFAGKWASGLLKAEADAPRLRSGRARNNVLGEKERELVVRVSKRAGRQLVKASAGRWSARKEALFLETLRMTGCVRSAAFACGLSTNALYRRREKDDDLREKWIAAAAAADDRLPGLLSAAAIAALDPEIDPKDLPPCSVREAIHICRMKGLGTSAARERAAQRNLPRVATNAEVRAALEKRLKAFSARVRAEDRAAGWSEDEQGRMIPPGWVFVGEGEAARAHPMMSQRRE